MRQRFWRFSGDVSATTERPNCMKPPSSSGRLLKSDSENGFTDETHFDSHFGPRAGNACRGRAGATGETEPLRGLAFVDLRTYRSGWSLFAVAAGRRRSLCGSLSFNF